MTHEEIMKMEPGPELNAMIAEHVFKWRKVKGPTTDYDGPCESFDVLVPPDIDDPYPLFPPKGAIKPWYFCKDWSGGISAAWEVVENMRETHKRAFTNELYGIMNPNRESFQISPIDLIWYMNPLNICKAALLAVMGE